jgi:integrase
MMARTKKSYQRGTVEKHNGFWTVRYYLIDALGNKTKKRDKLEISRSSSKRQALNAAEPIMVRVNEQNNNPKKEKERITFRDFVNGLWASYQIKEKLKDSTVYSYKSILKKHLLPTFDEKFLDEITPTAITLFFEKIAKEGIKPKYALNIYALLNIMFEVALQYDLIDVKPIRSKLHKPTYMQKEKPTLTLGEVKAILSEIDERQRFFFTLLFITGMRIGECCGLRWLNVDLQKKELLITNSLWRGKLTTPKTEASERRFVLPDSLLYLFYDHRERAGHRKAADFVFHRADGKPLDPDHLREVVLYPAMDRAGIARQEHTHGFHIFRHTAGSILYDETGRMKLVQKALGHSREQTTSDIYVHVAPEAVAETVEILSRELLADTSLFQPPTTGLIN